jgi:hypothetical protein
MGLVALQLPVWVGTRWGGYVLLGFRGQLGQAFLECMAQAPSAQL